MDILDVARALDFSDDDRETLAQFSSEATERLHHVGVRLLNTRRSLQEKVEQNESDLEDVRLELESEIKEFKEFNDGGEACAVVQHRAIFPNPNCVDCGAPLHCGACPNDL